MKIKCRIFVSIVLASFIMMTASFVCAAQKVTVMLDWFPNIDHLPIYVAQQEGFFTDEGLDVTILTPSSTTDALKLVASGNADIAVSYEPQVIIGASAGLQIRVVGRLVEHPLSVLLFLEGKGITKPSDLEGRVIGYTVPGMMDVLMEAFAKINGVKRYEPINVGFTIVQSLVAGKVDAIMGPYKNYETVELEEKGYRAGWFELNEWGIPDYDELVFISGERTATERPDVLRGFSSAIDRAISRTRKDPDRALATYFSALPEAPREMESKAFEITRPLYARSQTSDTEAWQKFADFAFHYGLIEKKVDVTAILGKEKGSI
ncbi:MAG TPA: ABC transporter substrate-binding protein [Syntrophales bacterium]|nr:ABC transporter substrate-binding protein [Syntrophales bacterium]HPQ45078.1 ABC transporter substrate-binding protein [Syntrophales bacterium]